MSEIEKIWNFGKVEAQATHFTLSLWHDLQGRLLRIVSVPFAYGTSIFLEIGVK